MKLIGREKELAIVREHVRAGRNLAVVGPAGVGKTALVREAVPAARYCADSSTVKTVCESLGFHAPDNIARKRALLRATAGGHSASCSIMSGTSRRSCCRCWNSFMNRIR